MYYALLFVLCIPRANVVTRPPWPFVNLGMQGMRNASQDAHFRLVKVGSITILQLTCFYPGVDEDF